MVVPQSSTVEIAEPSLTTSELLSYLKTNKQTKEPKNSTPILLH